MQNKPHKIEFCFCIGWFLSYSYTVLTLKFETILLCKCLYDDRVWPQGSAKIIFLSFWQRRIQWVPIDADVEILTIMKLLSVKLVGKLSAA